VIQIHIDIGPSYGTSSVRIVEHGQERKLLVRYVDVELECEEPGGKRHIEKYRVGVPGSERPWWKRALRLLGATI